jgi:hypothetical protein
MKRSVLVLVALALVAGEVGAQPTSFLELVTITGPVAVQLFIDAGADVTPETRMA